MSFDLDYIVHLTLHRESFDVEFKETTGQLDRGMESLCGMLNGNGGIVVFGVKNSGKIVGQEVSDKTTRMIGEALRRFEPSINTQPHYIKIPNSNKQLVVFHANANNPEAPFAYDGRPYQRYDSVTSVMPMEKFMRLHEQNIGLKYGWEKEVNPNLNLSMIDEGLLTKMISTAVNKGRLTGLALRDDTPTALRRLNLMRNGKLCNASAVLFGKNMFWEYPQCKLRLARFKGNEKRDFIDNQQFEGNIFEMLEAAMSFLFKHLSLTGTTRNRTYRSEELEIPYDALRETVLNALTHRAWQYETYTIGIAIYDDTVTIENIGRFPIGIEPNKLIREEENTEHNTSMPPNEIIANVLYLTGTIEHWGRGLSLIYNECERVGIPLPRITSDGHFVTVTFRRPDLSKWTPKDYLKDTPEQKKDTPEQKKDTPEQKKDTPEQKKDTVNPESVLSYEKQKYKSIIINLVNTIGEDWYSAYDIMDKLGLKSKSSFIRNHITPALELGLISLLHPDKPNSPNQKYGLSVKGKSIYYKNSISKD